MIGLIIHLMLKMLHITNIIIEWEMFGFLLKYLVNFQHVYEIVELIEKGK